MQKDLLEKSFKALREKRTCILIAILQFYQARQSVSINGIASFHVVLRRQAIRFQVINKLNSLAAKLSTRDFDECYDRIHQRGFRWNRKRVMRVYRLLQLNLRREKRMLPARIKEPLEQPKGINHT